MLVLSASCVSYSLASKDSIDEPRQVIIYYIILTDHPSLLYMYIIVKLQIITTRKYVDVGHL